MKRMLIIVAVVALAATLVVPATAATRWKSWGRATAAARSPMLTISGTVGKPTALRYHVQHSRGRRVLIDWMVSCDKDSPFRYGSRSGIHRVSPPATRSLPIPITAPDRCDIYINGSLVRGGGGRLTVVGQRR